MEDIFCLNLFSVISPSTGTVMEVCLRNRRWNVSGATSNNLSSTSLDSTSWRAPRLRRGGRICCKLGIWNPGFSANFELGANLPLSLRCVHQWINIKHRTNCETVRSKVQIVENIMRRKDGMLRLRLLRWLRSRSRLLRLLTFLRFLRLLRKVSPEGRLWRSGRGCQNCET